MSKGEPSEAVLEDEEPRIRKLIRLSALILLSPLIFSFVHEAGLFLISNDRLDLTIWFIGGFLLWVVTSKVISPEMPKVYEHFEHELAHAVVAFICLRDIRTFLVNPNETKAVEETSVVFYYGRSNPFIRLAPYYLPVFIPIA